MEVAQAGDVLFQGHGAPYPIGLEGAPKLKESCLIQSMRRTMPLSRRRLA
jgi:glucosamine 6-phosphate synthetase-like amidotransferase/phosphosugar isomerase protein